MLRSGKRELSRLEPNLSDLIPELTPLRHKSYDDIRCIEVYWGKYL